MRKSDSIKEAWDQKLEAFQIFEEEFSERNKLIDKVKTGELTPDEADRIAAEQGLDPILQKPATSEYDPRSQMTWSIPMAVAWIATGDDDEVREQCDDYRQKCARRPASLWDYVTIGLEDETARRREAYNLLRNALYEGKLTAEGTDKKGDRIDIRAHLWATLECTGTGRSPEFRSPISAEQFDHVRVRSSKVIEIWPARDNEISIETNHQGKPHQRFNQGKIKKAYQARVDNWPQDKKFPSEKEDLKWLRDESVKVPRAWFREIRREIVGPDRMKRGRRQGS